MRLACGLFGISVLAFSTALAPVQVQAGFEWVAPKEDMSQSGELSLPEPKSETPRISPQPLDGLDPLPPLSVNQENGTRQTVYAAPRRAKPVAVSESAPQADQSLLRSKTIQMNTPKELPRMAGAVSPPIAEGGPKQLRMSDKLIAPTDEEIGLSPMEAAPEAEGRVAINPAPVVTPVSPARREAMAAESMPAGPVLEGFGSDIPLVMALQQVLPPEYTYSFSGGVNPGESVSWEGGKNWAQVLGEMLDGAGLKATVKGRSVLIKGASSAQRAEATPANDTKEVNVADNMAATMAATMPAAGTPAVAESVEKVEAVPPVYPPEVLAKSSQEKRLLGRISEKTGLQIEEIKQTEQVQGSPELAKAARQNVVDRAFGLTESETKAESALKDKEQPIKLTSYSVTKTTHKLVEPPARRINITDPGQEAGTQPEVQALNLKPAASKETVMAAAADVPKVNLPSGTISKTKNPDQQRKKLEDMARQQGITLDAKSYNQDALGKVFNNGIAPASGDAEQPKVKSVPQKAPELLVAPAVTKPVSLKLPASPAAVAKVAKAAPVSLPVSSNDFWEAGKGSDLKKILGQWSKDSGVTLVWKSERDYKIGSNIMVHGEFNDAIKTLFAEGTKSGEFPVMRLNDGGAGNAILVVEDKS